MISEGSKSQKNKCQGREGKGAFLYNPNYGKHFLFKTETVLSFK